MFRHQILVVKFKKGVNMSTTRTVAQIETATTEFVGANKVKRAGFLILCVAEDTHALK